MTYDNDLPPRWQKTKGFIVAILIAASAYGAYKGYWTYRWLRDGIFRAHGIYNILAEPVPISPDGRTLLMADVPGRGRVPVPRADVLRMVTNDAAAQIAQRLAEQEKAKTAAAATSTSTQPATGSPKK